LGSGFLPLKSFLSNGVLSPTATNSREGVRVLKIEKIAFAIPAINVAKTA
jgi:hypothetical protein